MIELLFGAGIVLGGAAVYAVARKAGKANDLAYQKAVLDDASEWLADHLGIPAVEAQRELRDLTEGKDAPTVSRSLLRIDCEVIKQGPNSIKRTVAVAVADQGRVLVGKITRDLQWDGLPRAIREEFLRHEARTQTYLVYQKHEKAKGN